MIENIFLISEDLFQICRQIPPAARKKSEKICPGIL